jgi:DNA-binding NarL/FixJ family response regulator
MWLEHAQRSDVSDPFLRVAASELAFQEGNNREASRLADAAIAEFPETDSLAWRAWFDRAQSAYFSEDVDRALEYFARARDLADRPKDKQEALWGALCCANYAARPQANELGAEFASQRDESPEFRVRLATARANNATNFGGVEGALDAARATAPLLDSTDDVMIRSAFRHAWVSALTMNARYREAEVILDQAQREAESSRLLFAIDMIDSQRAGVEAGKGRYPRAAALAARVEKAASEREDLFLLLVSLMHRARLGALSRDPLRVDIPHVSPIPTGAYSEYLSAIALLRAAQGDAAAALAYAEEVEATISTIEAKVHAAFVRAIVEHQEAGPSVGALATAAFERAREAGAYDPFVYAYRVCNPILGTLLASGAAVEMVASVLHRAGDRELARRFNLGRPGDYARSADLTPREEEVLKLMARGLTNREIAEILFVSPVTVKVHLRHIYEKLGVRSRTEAALRAQARNLI